MQMPQRLDLDRGKGNPKFKHKKIPKVRLRQVCRSSVATGTSLTSNSTFKLLIKRKNITEEQTGSGVIV